MTRAGMRRAPRAGDLERERDVLLGRAVFEQAEILEHDPQPAPQLGNVAPRDLVHVEPDDAHLAARHGLLGVDQLAGPWTCPAPEWPVRKANSPLAMWKETSFSARPPLGKALKTLVNLITYSCASACAKSAMRSSASSSPRENLRKPSGNASLRPLAPAVSDAWDVSRGSDTSVSTPPRLGAWVAIVSARRNRSAAAGAALQLDAPACPP